MNQLTILKKSGINLIYWDKTIRGEVDPPEESEILAENAMTKAKFAYEKHGIFALGDDSALCIEGLDYFPGVHSRRWARCQ